MVETKEASRRINGQILGAKTLSETVLIGVTVQFPRKHGVSHKGEYINGVAHELFIFLPPYRFILLLMVFFNIQLAHFGR
jgi:hypothetical protein